MFVLAMAAGADAIPPIVFDCLYDIANFQMTPPFVVATYFSGPYAEAIL
jgi:hypothetical protein